MVLLKSQNCAQSIDYEKPGGRYIAGRRVYFSDYAFA
jgi:hypothetical protein